MAARRRALLTLAALLSAACVQDDGRRFDPIPGHQRMSAESQRELGWDADREILKALPMIHDVLVLEFVDDLGQLLVEHLGEQPFEYRFRVLVNPELNAFAVPGGYVYFHSGTLLGAGDVEELAGVMAHELGHVKGEHQARMAQDAAIPSLLASLAGIAASAATRSAAPMIAAQGANVALQLQYTRQYESEADNLATVFMTRAGYSPEGLVRFFERIQLEERRGPKDSVPAYLYSHPGVDERIDVVKQLATSLHPVAARPDLDARFAAMQGRLAWCTDNQRASWSYVESYDRTATDPLLAAAAQARAAEHPDQALAALERAERLEPNDPRVAFARGEIYAAEGRLDDAIASYRRAVALDPNQAAVLFALARAYKAAGNRHKAVFFFEQASWRAGEKGPLRGLADGEIERAVFPLVESSGFADGGSADGAATVAGAPRTEFAAGDLRIAWWAKLGSHWLKYSDYFKVRWVDPSGTVGEAAKPQHPKRASLAAVRDAPLAPGTWRVELVLSDQVVYEERVEVKP